MKIQARLRERIVPRELKTEFTDQLDTVRAWSYFAEVNLIAEATEEAIEGQSTPEKEVIANALNSTIPVLSGIADRLEAQVEVLRSWNISSAGKNEVIQQAIERNWSSIRKLDTGGVNGG
jgi:hypothetical protein